MQVAKASGTSFTMAHKTGLAIITLGTQNVPNIRYFNATETSYTDDGSYTATASNTLTDKSMLLSGLTCYYIVKSSTNVSFVGTGLDAWTTSYTANIGTGCYENTFTAQSKRLYRYKGWLYDYTGGMQNLTITQAGSYKLEVWGAQGGDWGTDTGGKGGYATGNTTTSVNQNLYICVGQAGKQNERNVAANWGMGYNGGGRLITGGSGSSGGGATHIATGSTNRGELRYYESYKSEVIIVAGAGGGASSWNGDVNVSGTIYPAEYVFYGGYGGGLTGGSTEGLSAHISYIMHFYGGGQDGPIPGSTILYNGGDPSTTNEEGGFGYGGLGLGGGHCAGSGGAGWYGGTGGYDDSAGGGGSSWIGSNLLSDGVTIAGNTSMIQPNGTTSIGHSGNGYARITTNFEWAF